MTWKGQTADCATACHGARCTGSVSGMSWWLRRYLCHLYYLYGLPLDTNSSPDDYNIVLRSNAPFSFKATPFSVTIAVMSSAGVTSKLGL